MIVCDTGPLVAAALADDDHHHACVELFTGLHLARRELLVPATVVPEVGYLLAREAGHEIEAMFLSSTARVVGRVPAQPTQMILSRSTRC